MSLVIPLSKIVHYSSDRIKYVIYSGEFLRHFRQEDYDRLSESIYSDPEATMATRHKEMVQAMRIDFFGLSNGATIISLLDDLCERVTDLQLSMNIQLQELEQKWHWAAECVRDTPILELAVKSQDYLKPLGKQQKELQ